MEDTASIISLVAVIIATASTLISYLIFRTAIEPNVIVYASLDEKRPTIINLIIENTGRGVAWDVQFKSPPDFPMNAFGFENAKKPLPMNTGPLITGIPCFGPSSKRVISWGQHGGLHKGIGDNHLDITATYFSRPPLSLKARKHETISRLDIKSFESCDISDNNWDKKSAQQLEAIAASTSGLLSLMQEQKKP